MLVTARRPRSADDGVVLITVVIVMFVLAAVAIVVAALVVNTAGVLVNGRSTAQSRAVADAGIAEAVAEARRTGDVCDIDLTESQDEPPFSLTVTSTCADGLVTFESTGTATGASAKTQAVYEIRPATPPAGADIYAHGPVTMAAEVLAPPSRPLSILVGSGDFACDAAVPGDVSVAGEFEADGDCTVAGRVWAEDVDTFCCVTIDGDVIAHGSGAARIRGTVGGRVWTAGDVRFGSAGTIGSVVAGGDVDLSGASVTGSVTLPVGADFDGAPPGGGVTEVTAPPVPPAPTFTAWFDYAFRPSDWPGYAVSTIAAEAGAEPASCDDFADGAAWNVLTDVSAKGSVIVDARACDGLSHDSGPAVTIRLANDMVILADGFDLDSLRFESADGQVHNLWLITEDADADSRPDCGAGAEPIIIDGTDVVAPVRAMIYTPCPVEVSGAGSEAWNGSVYAGSLAIESPFAFSGDPALLPGQTAPTAGTAPGAPTGPNELGDLVSRRDVP